MIDKQAAEDDFFDNIFMSPHLAVPEIHEIVVIACELENGAKIFQTAAYEQTDEGREIWLCGQPFAHMLFWYSLRNFDRLCKTLDAKKPKAGEIVVVACVLETGEAVFQTAIYAPGEGNADGIVCGQPYEKLVAWSPLPDLPKQTLLLPKKPGFIN